MTSVIDWRGALLALPLVGLVLLFAWLYFRNQKGKKKKTGQYMRFQSSAFTAAGCRGLLGKRSEDDLFTYKLETAPTGGWYLTLTGHKATGQPLETVFLLQFEDESPAIFSLKFVREAFGMREPVVGEDLLCEFFLKKLSARPIAPEELNPQDNS